MNVKFGSVIWSTSFPKGSFQQQKIRNLTRRCFWQSPLHFIHFVSKGLKYSKKKRSDSATSSKDQENLTYFMLNFVLCWPYISIHLRNKNKLDAPFIFSLFRQATSTGFGHICSPSSGRIMCVYNKWNLCFLVDCLLAGLGWNVPVVVCVCIYIYIYI